MSERGTPQRVVRIEKAVWMAYGKLCAQEGTSRSGDMRRYVYARVNAWRAQERATGAGRDGAGE